MILHANLSLAWTELLTLTLKEESEFSNQNIPQLLRFETSDLQKYLEKLKQISKIFKQYEDNLKIPIVF